MAHSRSSKIRLQMCCQSRQMDNWPIRRIRHISECESECRCPKAGSRKTFCGHGAAVVRAMTLGRCVNRGNSVRSPMLCPVQSVAVQMQLSEEEVMLRKSRTTKVEFHHERQNEESC